MNLLKLVVGGNPYKNFGSWCYVDMVSSVVWEATRRLYGRRCWAEMRSKK